MLQEALHEVDIRPVIQIQALYVTRRFGSDRHLSDPSQVHPHLSKALFPVVCQLLAKTRLGKSLL